jgi:hypothetical protein
MVFTVCVQTLIIIENDRKDLRHQLAENLFRLPAYEVLSGVAPESLGKRRAAEPVVEARLRSSSYLIIRPQPCAGGPSIRSGMPGRISPPSMRIVVPVM